MLPVQPGEVREVMHFPTVAFCARTASDSLTSLHEVPLLVRQKHVVEVVAAVLLDGAVAKHFQDKLPPSKYRNT